MMHDNYFPTYDSETLLNALDEFQTYLIDCSREAEYSYSDLDAMNKIDSYVKKIDEIVAFIHSIE